MSNLPIARFTLALPFWMALLLIPLACLSVIQGGWMVFLVPLASWGLATAFDQNARLNLGDADTDTPDDALFWYRLVTLIWAPIQFVTVFGLIGFMVRVDHLALWEVICATFGLGILVGVVGIVFGHELMHQQSRLERWLGDIQMTMAQYGHFRSEHLLVHHRYVGTPMDTVTARYNEQFHAFFPRVVWQSLRSSWQAEAQRLAKKGLPAWDRANPFWRYWMLQLGFILIALIVGGWLGLVLYLFMAGVAVWQLELVNYIEHYGLTRKHLGDGRYEHVEPRHSWNSSHRATNWLMINLQRHSDHHHKPDRRFPLLQNYSVDEAPQLPFSYPLMGIMALYPPLWRRRMNPLVQHWRKTFYPEITDWRSYTAASNPMPR